MEVKRQRAKVHMLPTEDIKGYALYTHHKGYLIEGIRRVGEPNGTQQHLYFTTDEEIKEGDWVLFPKTKDDKGELNCIGQIISIVDFEVKISYNDFIIPMPKSYCKKIVALTDTSLGLPQPSQAFIQKYCELGGIDEVDIEYEFTSTPVNIKIPIAGYIHDWKLKVDSHNTITIRSIKDSWSREEHIDNLIKYRNAYEQYKRSCHFGPNEVEISKWSNQWIEENL